MRNFTFDHFGLSQVGIKEPDKENARIFVIFIRHLGVKI